MGEVGDYEGDVEAAGGAEELGQEELRCEMAVQGTRKDHHVRRQLTRIHGRDWSSFCKIGVSV